MENQIPQVPEIPEILEGNKRQKKVYVSRQDCTRYDEATGKYNSKPVDPEYFKKYYQNHREKVKCEICNKTTGKFKMYRHLKSQKCQLASRSFNYAKPSEQCEPPGEITFKILETLD